MGVTSHVKDDKRYDILLLKRTVARQNTCTKKKLTCSIPQSKRPTVGLK